MLSRSVFVSQEIATAGGKSGVRDLRALESALVAPQVSFNGQFLMDIFEMVATDLNSIALNHPFFDGNKRTAHRQKEEWLAS